MKRPIFLFLFLLPAVAQGQRRCVDSLAGASWRATPLLAAVTSPVAGDRDRDRYVAALLNALPRGFIDPGADEMPTGAMTQVPPPELRAPVHATLELDIDRNGHAVDGRVVKSSGNPALDIAMLQAVRIVGGPAGLGKMPRKLRGDTVRFTIQVDDRDAPAGAVGFGSLSSSYLQAEIAPRIRSMPPARAPRGHHGKRVVLAGTVGSDGRIIAPTIRVISSNDSVLTPIARASFEHTLFRPGTKHGCPAEATIRQVFPFP